MSNKAIQPYRTPAIVVAPEKKEFGFIPSPPKPPIHTHSYPGAFKRLYLKLFKNLTLYINSLYRCECGKVFQLKFTGAFFYEWRFCDIEEWKEAGGYVKDEFEDDDDDDDGKEYETAMDHDRPTSVIVQDYIIKSGA